MHITKDETERMVFLRNVHQRTAWGNVLVHVVSPFPSMLEIIRDLANSERVTRVILSPAADAADEGATGQDETDKAKESESVAGGEADDAGDKITPAEKDKRFDVV